MSGHGPRCACDLATDLVAPYVTTIMSLTSEPERLNLEVMTGVLAQLVSRDDADDGDVFGRLTLLALASLTELVMRDVSVCAAIEAVRGAVRDAVPLTGDDVIEGATHE